MPNWRPGDHPPPDMDSRLAILQERMAAAGYPVKIVSRKRTAEQQAHLYAQGRSRAGSIITEKSGKPGDESLHQLGRAADFGFVGEENWDLLGREAKNLGLEWGGDWKSLVDKPHVQMVQRGVLNPSRPFPKGGSASGYSSPASVAVQVANQPPARTQLPPSMDPTAGTIRRPDVHLPTEHRVASVPTQPKQPAQTEEQAFRRWYADMARQYDLNPDPDSQQFYDYRAAFRAGAKPDASRHWPSDFKKPGHPNEIVGGFNTRTGERVAGTKRASEQELVSLGWDHPTAKRLAQMPEPTQAHDQFDALARRFGGAVEGQRPGYDAPPVSAEQFMDPAASEGSAAGRFFSNLGEVLNPITMAQGLYQAVRHPIDTAGNIIQQQVGQGRQAIDMARQGRYSEAAGHGGAALLPLIGPAAAQAGEQIGAGDIAGGLGRATGILAPVAGVPAVRAAARVLPNKAATALETGAQDRIADVMSPKVGPNKTRFGNNAEKVAPAIAKDLAKEGAPMTREGLHARVGGKLAEAERGLDAVADARLSARTFETKPIIDDLMRKRQELMAEAPEATGISYQNITVGGKHATTWIKNRGPIGEDVLPRPRNPRAEQIDEAIRELQRLGPVARYESIQQIRQAFDGPAKVKYSPAVTTDYLAKQGGATGAADVTGVLREHLAKWDPETAVANANYHIYKTADDVLEATREVERVRPKMGRAIMARLTGTIFGGQAGGTSGAVAGYALGPVADSLLAAGGTTKLKTAAMMQRLAQAIRGGDMATVDSLADQLKRLTAESGAAMNATSPSGSQRPLTPAAAIQP